MSRSRRKREGFFESVFGFLGDLLEDIVVGWWK